MRPLSSCIAIVLLTSCFCLSSQANPPEQTGTAQAETFSDAVAEKAMDTLRRGLIGHSPELMLSAFDRDKMPGYSAFADQVRAFFEQYDSFRVYARILHSSVENGRGIATLQFELDETPRDPTVSPIRKIAEVRLEFERGAKGWKIVEIRPRKFFSY
ncbi:MAG: hypothetical protein ACE14M_01165 [Terriglobales bacterium]